MSLLLRVNLALIVAFAVGATIAGLACRTLLQRNAEHEIRAEAELMIDGALAARDYTASEVEPLLRTQMQTRFLAQSIPFYAATEHFLRLHENHPEYAYRAATLNPTNLRDRATEWQADIIERFRNDANAHEIRNRAAVRSSGVEQLLTLLGREIESEAERRKFIAAARDTLRGRS
jgi:protein-histidine pros-kinase